MRNYIKEIRERADVSQVLLAKKLGLTQSGFSHLETGRRRLTLELAWEISKVLGVPIEAILTGETQGASLKHDKQNDKKYREILLLCLGEWKKPTYSRMSAQTVLEIAQSIYDEATTSRDKDISAKISSLMSYAAKHAAA